MIIVKGGIIEVFVISIGNFSSLSPSETVWKQWKTWIASLSQTSLCALCVCSVSSVVKLMS